MRAYAEKYNTSKGRNLMMEGIIFYRYLKGKEIKQIIF